jgi:hypothetical protein
VFFTAVWDLGFIGVGDQQFAFELTAMWKCCADVQSSPYELMMLHKQQRAKLLQNVQKMDPEQELTDMFGVSTSRYAC